MRKKRFSVAIPIVIGFASAILWRVFIPESPSAEVYQWVYSTIVQAYAAMVAVVGMFAIYRLQFLRHNLETEAEKLESAVANYNGHKDHHTGTPLATQVTVSDDFVGDEKGFEKLGQELGQDMKYIMDRQKNMGTRGKTVLNELTKQKLEDYQEYCKLVSIKKDLNLVNVPYKRMERAKESVMRITKTIKLPLVISGFLIGTSLVLLSLSDTDFINTALSLFLWFLAGVIGTAICLTYMLVRETLVLVEA